MNKNEFYIGWMKDAPNNIAAFVKKYVLVLLTIVIVLSVLLALSQKKFGKGTFEFGTLTEVRGVYFAKPIPNLKVMNGKDIWGNASYITIPLIGYGKFGLDGVISDIEKQQHVVLESKAVTIKGTLLYNDGKILMQVDGNDQPINNIAAAGTEKNEILASKDIGTLQLKGEIVDPKCFFGVMKPGEGKPHKDCAIRCILGGIPPVLRVNNTNGTTNYYFILGANGEKMNRAVQSYVAAPVEIKAKAVQYNDWIVLYVGNNGITELSRSALLQKGDAIACVSCR
jgi:hypothetical protein